MSITALGLGKSVAAIVGVLAVGVGGYTMMGGDCLLSCSGGDDTAIVTTASAAASTDSCALACSGDKAEMVQNVSLATDAGECGMSEVCEEAVAQTSCCSSDSADAVVQTVSMTTDATTGAECEKACETACETAAECAPAACEDKTAADCESSCTSEAIAADETVSEEIEVTDVTNG